VMHAEQPVEFEPSALRPDRERHRDTRSRREMRARAERVFRIPGAVHTAPKPRLRTASVQCSRAPQVLTHRWTPVQNPQARGSCGVTLR
jgi:hypothetical protein